MSGTTAITPSITFGGQVGSIALSLLDTNFTQVATFLNNANNYSNYLVDTGAANSIVVTTPTSVTATYTAGLTIAVKVIASNTGASTVNVNSLGLKNILNPDGSALTNNQMPANSVVALIYDGTQFLLVGGSPSAINIAGGTKGQVPVQSAVGTTTFMDSSFGFKNRIINGGCAVSQYGSVSIAANTNKTYGGCDRIALQTTSFTTISGTLVQSGSAGSGASATGFVQQFGPVTTTGSGTITFFQRIEAVNVGDLNSSAVTISLSLYQDTGSTLSPTINLYKPNALNDYTSSTFINGVAVSLPTGVRTTFTYTLTLGASDATNGLQVQINIPVGAITSKYFQIGNLQLEKGSTATSFDYRPYGTELALCQRYYYQYTGNASTQTPIAPAFLASTVSAQGLLQFPVPMRAAPTQTSSAAADTEVTWSAGTSTTSALTLDLVSTLNASLRITTTGLTAGQGGYFRIATGATKYLAFSAEL